MDRPETLPLDCPPLDDLLGGGIEHGVITNVYGAAGSGKTNVCVQAAVAAVEAGDDVVFVDTEGGFSAERFLQMHGDEAALDRIRMYEPTTFEEQEGVFRTLQEAAADTDAGLVVVDSLVSLYRLHLQDDTVQEVNTVLSSQFATLSKIARTRDIPVVVTNQVYSRFDSEGTELVGRDIPAYWSKTLLNLEKTETRNERVATLEKHRSRPAGEQARFRIAQDGLTATEQQPPSGEMKIF